MNKKEIKAQLNSQINSLKKDQIVPFDLEKDDSISENYTVNAFPNDEIINKIIAIQKELKALDPNHFYYPSEALHITLLGNIDINISEGKLIKVIREEINNIDISFTMAGLNSNERVSSFTAFPNFDLFGMRNRIREKLEVPTDDYTKWISAYEHIGWINYLRYQNNTSDEFLNLIRNKKDEYFGIFKATSIKMLRNSSKTLNKKKYTIIDEITFS